MVVGDAPAVRLDTGYVERLPTDGVALEARAEELLRTWFFLDTLARRRDTFPRIDTSTSRSVRSSRFTAELATCR